MVINIVSYLFWVVLAVWVAYEIYDTTRWLWKGSMKQSVIVFVLASLSVVLAGVALKIKVGGDAPILVISWLVFAAWFVAIRAHRAFHDRKAIAGGAA